MEYELAILWGRREDGSNVFVVVSSFHVRRRMASYVVGLAWDAATYSHIFLHTLTYPYILLTRYSIQYHLLGIHPRIVQALWLLGSSYPTIYAPDSVL
jgi:hypothetical protein